MKDLLLIACCCLVWATTFAQQPAIIQLENPSFEDMPGSSHVPYGWTPCGFPNQSPPDTNPTKTFGEKPPAYDGNTYLGMVVRDNDTWEGVSQELSQSLVSGQCYGLTFSASGCKTHRSLSQKTGEQASYELPTRLRIWAGYDFCESLQLLAETLPVAHYEWRTYSVFFVPNAPYTHLFLEAYFVNDQEKAYCGNVLLDNLSNLSPVTCPQNFLSVEQPVWDGSKLPSKPDTVQFFMPKDLKELESLVAKHSRKIRFEADHQLERQLYYVAQEGKGFRFFQNQALHYLIAVVKEMPKAKLTIAIAETNPQALSAKTESVRQLLKFMNAPQSRIKLVPLSKKEAEKHWVGTREGVLMRLGK